MAFHLSSWSTPFAPMSPTASPTASRAAARTTDRNEPMPQQQMGPRAVGIRVEGVDLSYGISLGNR